MAYALDFNKIELGQYLEELSQKELLPSRSALKFGLEKRFTQISRQGIRNLQDLRAALKTKKRLEDFATRSGVNMEYLILLAREINSMESRPVKLRDFPNVDMASVQALEGIGIDSSEQLFNASTNKEKREHLIEMTGIKPSRLDELVRLSDLVRIQWVGTAFARILWLANIDTVEKVASSDEQELYQKIGSVMEKSYIGIAKLGMKDAKRCIHAARQLTYDIQY